MRTLGLIPARGGSKRLPGKNIRPLCGEPLIAWTIKEAIKAGSLDRVVVSTENPDIADRARMYGARVLDRPAWLATDRADIYDVIRHALKALDENFTHVCLLHPTSPLRIVQDIDRTVQACSVSSASAIEERFHPNGAVYCATVGWINAGGNWDRDWRVLTHMPLARSVDIDTAQDFEHAETLLAQRIGWQRLVTCADEDEGRYS